MLRLEEMTVGPTEAISLEKIDFCRPVPWEILDVADIHRCSFNQSQGGRAIETLKRSSSGVSGIRFVDNQTCVTSVAINIREVLSAVSRLELYCIPSSINEEMIPASGEETARPLIDRCEKWVTAILGKIIERQMYRAWIHVNVEMTERN